MARTIFIAMLPLLLITFCGCPSHGSSPPPDSLSPRIIGTYDFGEKAVTAGSAGEIASKNYLFVGTYQEKEEIKTTLRVLSLDAPDMPLEIGSLALMSPKGNVIASIALSGTVLLVSTVTELWLVDVSIPEKPTLLDQLKVEFPLLLPVIIGETVFWNTGTKYVTAIDISDTSKLVYAGFASDNAGGIIAGSGQLLFGLSNEGLHIFDGSSRPLREMGFYADPTGVEEEAAAGMNTEDREKLEKTRFLWAAAAGNYVYLACGINGLRVIDVAAPSKPKVTAYLEINGMLEWLGVSGSYIYLLNTDRTLREEKHEVEILILDVSKADSPKTAGAIFLPDNWEIHPLVSSDCLYYFVENYQGKGSQSTWNMQIIEIYIGN